MIDTSVRPLRRTAPVLRSVAGAGLIIMVIGTFLPWLRSGSVARNSYAADASLRELIGSRVVHAAMTVWPFITLACAGAAVLLLLGRTRVGAALAVLAAAAGGAVAVATVQRSSSGVVRAAGPGPAVTLAGAALTLIVAGYLLVRGRTS